jgi:hypothetical protein
MWIGMAATSIHPERGFALSEMTGVLRSYRGRGVSIGMKVIAIEFARQRNLRSLRSRQPPRQRAGYRDEPTAGLRG